MTPTHPRLARWAPAVLLLVALVTAVAAWFVRAEAQEQQTSADESVGQVDALQAARLRIVISASAFVELTHQLEELAGEARRPATAEPIANLERSAEELSRLVADGRVPEAAAPIVEDILEVAERAVADPGDLWALEEVAYISTTPSTFGPPEALPDRLLLATVLATSPSLVAIDALTLELDTSLDSLTPEVADYVDSTASIVQDDPGWFGPDRDTPFVGGYLPGDLLEDVDPELLAALRAAAEIDEVWSYDQWLIARLDSEGDAPHPLSEIAPLARDAQAPLVDLLLARVDVAIAEATVDAPSAVLTRGWVVLAGTAVTAVLALAVVAFVRTRRLAAVAFGDPLTGTANRHRLHQLELEWAADGGPPYAAVAVLDLDRFKLINDSMGHAAGDHVLRHVGRGLNAVAEALRPNANRVEVVRMGGDEFAVVVASSTPQVEATLQDRIAAIGGPVEVGNGETVDIGVSVGVVMGAHPHDLASMIAAADLRAYETKQQRRATSSPAADTDDLRL